MRTVSLLLCLLLVPQLLAAQDAQPAAAVAAGAPRVRVVTSAGNFVIELDHNRAPRTVDAFLKYVKEGFYSGVIFHRVVAGFIAQAGGYTADMQPKAVTEQV
ncbi:MAG TPA: peptidylprolyl isomerase, partial [Gammaproteobacteria bacterium]|nr:peptidylprolyl isomerase [Gammaproteobacteria bacterium]